MSNQVKDKLLVVDDEADMLRLLQRSVSEELDCEIDVAASGKEALQLLKAGTYDLALVDIRMPGMDGLELLEHIKMINPWMTVVMQRIRIRGERSTQRRSGTTLTVRPDFRKSSAIRPPT